MKNIIQLFLENVTNFNKKEEINFSEIVENIKTNGTDFLLSLLKNILEELDTEISQSIQRKQKWYIERYDERTILTSLGKVTFTRRYYKSKHGKIKYSYLLDEAIGITKYSRIDVPIEARLLEFATELSYEKAGELFNENNKLSKQTVRNKVIKFGASKIMKNPERTQKKEIKNLFIDADEDHISLQNGKNKINKLIYVYEGKIKESKNRNYLINKKSFASVKKKSEDLWLEVLNYIYETYDLEKIEKIYIQGDGANWIKSGVSWIDKSIHVIDMFHLNKEIMKLAGGSLKDGIGKELKKLVYQKDKESFLKIANSLINFEEDEKRKKKKTKSLGYIKNQWKGIVEFIDNKEKHKLGCSAEGSVSHILASRMSSRPKGWSVDGLEAITKLRLFKLNSGTFEQLKEILKNKNIEINLKRKNVLKNKKRLMKKVGEVLHNITVLNVGKSNGSYFAVKNYARY